MKFRNTTNLQSKFVECLAKKKEGLLTQSLNFSFSVECLHSTQTSVGLRTSGVQMVRTAFSHTTEFHRNSVRS